MNWDSIQALIAMGGHGPYVWGSVLVTGAALALELALLARRKRAALAAALRSARGSAT